jgi:hypothetical protein
MSFKHSVENKPILVKAMQPDLTIHPKPLIYALFKLTSIELQPHSQKIIKVTFTHALNA